MSLRSALSRPQDKVLDLDPVTMDGLPASPGAVCWAARRLPERTASRLFTFCSESTDQADIGGFYRRTRQPGHMDSTEVRVLTLRGNPL